MPLNRDPEQSYSRRWRYLQIKKPNNPLYSMPLYNSRRNLFVLDFDLWDSFLWKIAKQGFSVEPLNVVGLHKIFRKP